MSSPNDFSALLSSGQFSDLKLICRGQVFNVHKAIVCAQSPVLTAACVGGFVEASSNTINIAEFDPETVKRMVAFMYGKDYEIDVKEEESKGEIEIENEISSDFVKEDDEDPPTSRITETSDILLCHVNVAAIADYYDITTLKEVVNRKIKTVLDTNWSPDGFSTVIKKAFDSTSDPELRNLLASAAAEHILELVGQKDFFTCGIVNDFAADLLKEVMTKYNTRNKELQEELINTKSRLEANERYYEQEKAQCEALGKRISYINDSIDGCHDKLRETDICRNPRCDVEFKCYIESGGTSDRPTYTLRCARCHCRHK